MGHRMLLLFRNHFELQAGCLLEEKVQQVEAHYSHWAR